MAKDLELNVRGDSKSATAALAAAAREMDKAAREADKLGRAFDAAKRDAAQLDRELARNAVAVKALAREYATSNDDIRAGIKQRLDAERNAGAELKRVRKDVVGDAEKGSRAASSAFAKARNEFEKLKPNNRDRGFGGFFATAAIDAAREGIKVGEIFGDGIMSTLGNAFKALPPEAQAGIVAGLGAAVVLAGPIIAAAISGAILVGVGAAGIGAGIALAVKSADVQTAFKGLGGTVKSELTDAAKPFRAELVATAGIFGNAFQRALPDLRGTFAVLATAVQPLAHGLAGLAVNALPGIREAAAAAVPLFKAIGDELPRLGAAVSSFFSSIAQAGPGAIATFKFIFLNIEGMIVVFGKWLEMMSRAAAGLGLISGLLSPDQASGVKEFGHSLQDTSTGFSDVADGAESAVGSVGDFKNAITDAAQTVDTQWAGAIDAVVGNMLSLDKATLGWDETLTKLDKSIDKNGTSLKEHTKEGQKNRDAILDGVQANLRLFDAEVKSGTSAEEAGKHFQAHNDQLRAAAIAAGFNAGEVDKMIQKYGKVPAEIQTQIEMHGLQEALANLDETLRLINHLPPRKSVDIDVNVHGNLFAAAGAISKVLGSGYVSSGLGKRAAGGPVKAGQAYIVGENQAELFVPSVNGMIEPSVPKGLGQSGPSVVSRWGGTGSGGQAITVTLNLAGSDTAMGTAVHKLIREGYAQLRAVDSSGNSLPVKVA